MTLEFPWKEAPPEGTRREIAPGIDWVCMPLPFRLNHVNCWWLTGEAGATVQIDTGVASQRTHDLWKSAVGGDPDTLLITHFHPDHSGCAGQYAERGVTLLGSEIEMRLGRAIHELSDQGYANLYAAWYTRNGLPAEAVEQAHAMGNGYRQVVAAPAPIDEFTWLQHGDVVTLAGRDWHVMMGHGHAPAMLMLHDPEAGVLIAADQVLPTISPNVSAGPSLGPGLPSPFGLEEADPLARFLASLEALRRLPQDTLVLPSHGVPFRGLHQRLDELSRHHRERLAAMLEACAEPRTAAELFGVLFGRKMDPQQMSFALGEALAHADHLVCRGQLLREEGTEFTTFVRG